MLVRSAPLDGGAISPEQLGGDTAAGLGSLLDAAPRAGLDLPCRSGDADLWFAEAPSGAGAGQGPLSAVPDPGRVPGRRAAPGEPWGVWGGEIFERGAVIPRKRPRGRPSKADLARDRAYAAAIVRLIALPHP